MSGYFESTIGYEAEKIIHFFHHPILPYIVRSKLCSILHIKIKLGENDL